MKVQNLFLALVFLVGTFMTKAHASSDPKVEWKTQIVNYLDDIDVDRLENIEAIMIDFMVNENDEIIVLSTNVKKLDNWIKMKLNYKKLNAESFETFTKYSLPIKFNKK